MKIDRVEPVPPALIIGWRAHGGNAGLATTSKTQMAKLLGMTGSQVNDVLMGRRRHAKGWTFAYAEGTDRKVNAKGAGDRSGAARAGAGVREQAAGTTGNRAGGGK